MSTMLQGSTTTNGGTASTNGPAEIVINADYVNVATQVVRRAKGELRIFAYAWRWYEHRPESKIQSFNVALQLAMRRGVVVRAIVESDEMYNMLTARGIQCRKLPGNRSMHAKVIAGDRQDLLLGSHNLTMRAFEDNIEASVLVHDFEPIEQYCVYFDSIWNAYG